MSLSGEDAIFGCDGTQERRLFQETPRRRELKKWFREKALPLAPSYEGAVRLIEDTEFPGRIHFIAHAVRDIAHRLPFVLDPCQDGNRVQYENALDDIEKKWPTLDSFSKTDFPSGEETISIPVAVAKHLDKLVAEHRKRRARPTNSELLFRFLSRMNPTRQEANKRVVSYFGAIRRWFMEATHLPAVPPPPVDERELQRQFERFENILHSFVGDFFTGTRELDAILQQANR